MIRAEECLYVGDGGSGELEAAREMGMSAMQVVWYLKESPLQPTGRRKGFPQLEKPLAVLDRLGKQTTEGRQET